MAFGSAKLVIQNNTKRVQLAYNAFNATRRATKK